jgi:hypothetical protein
MAPRGAIFFCATQIAASEPSQPKKRIIGKVAQQRALILVECPSKLFERFPGAPLLSSIADRYFARHGGLYSMRPSEQVRGLFERWSIKFSADYYKAKGPGGRSKRPAFALAAQSTSPCRSRKFNPAGFAR